MDSWWIDEPFVLGSSNPSTDKLEELSKKSFKVIVCLLNEGHQRPYYDPDKIKDFGYTRYQIPINDFCPPTLEQYQSFSEILDNNTHDKKIILHCEGGLGRTGTMAAAYWIKKGLGAQEAIEKVRKLNPFAIETREQKESLFAFEEFLSH